MSTGAPLNLTLEPSGTKGWAAAVNANFSGINTAIAALQAGGTTGPTGPAGAAGPVGMVYAGGWQSTTAYAITDVVTFNGSSYIAIAASTGVQPDINPTVWEPVALAGAAGPIGPTGPQGPAGSGSGSSIPLPVSIADGGTAAVTAAAALVSLGAAARGINTDIHELAGVSGVDIASGTITLNNGTERAILTAASLSIAQILGQGGTGGIQIGTGGGAGAITSVNTAMSISNGLQVTDGTLTDWLTLSADAQVVAAGQISLGTTTASTATTGSASALPGPPAGYARWNVGGTWVKFPYWND